MGCGGSKTNESSAKYSGQFEKDELTIQKEVLVVENKSPISKSYKVLEKLGEGTFGRVYKVLHIATAQIRAMKLVRRESVKYQDDEKKFLKEIEVLAKLDHPNIIKVFEYFVDNKFYYLITEFTAGGELYEQITKIQFYNEIDAAVIMRQIFSAVFYLHNRNICHRDLKPENLMLETNVKGDLTIKIIDFGAANIFEKKEAKMTLKVGTPFYIAPEVINRQYDLKCDMWSCGVILFILLVGYPPFDGEGDEEVMNNVLKGQYSLDTEEWSNVSKEAKNLIKKLLVKDPSKRMSAEEALKDPWIIKNYTLKEKANKVPIPKIPADTLKKFSSKQKLQQASIAFLVHQMSSNEMVKNLRSIFKQLDVSGDGRLSHQELKDGYKQYFADSLSEQEFDELINRLDGDNNGYVEYEEFLRATVDTASILSEKNLRLAFDFFDKDGSGMLSADEIKDVLGVVKDDNEKGDLIAKVIAEVDTNGDGEVSFEEFKNLMKKNIL